MTQVLLEDINKKIKDRAFLEKCDKEYLDNVRKTAQAIIDKNDDCAIILISGPSGSGKTTTALTLEKMLDSCGHETHVLSMDNYFYPMTKEQQKLALEDKIDLESPERVDKDFLNAQLADIIACKPVKLPKFNFKDNIREDSGITLHRKPGECVILEGIHALNPDVIKIDKDKSVRVYVSVRSRVKTPEGNIIHPEYIRLIRRMHRDATQRGRSYSETVKMYPRVQRGENLYIMPYKHLADFDFDTFVPYELNVFSFMDLDALKKERIGDKFPQIIELLKSAEPLDKKEVGQFSLLREFIGGSKFEY